MAKDPVVFISSTSADLKEHRQQAAAAARALGFSTRMMEDFTASGEMPSLEGCLQKVSDAEVVIAIVAHRYGWVPDVPTNTDGKSITWLECEHAWRITGKEVLGFLVDETYPWPAEFREDYRLISERRKAAIQEEVEGNELKLTEFKKKLSGPFIKHFTDAASLRPLVGESLADWRRRHLASAERLTRQLHLRTRKYRPRSKPLLEYKFLETKERGITAVAFWDENSLITGNSRGKLDCVQVGGEWPEISRLDAHGKAITHLTVIPAKKEVLSCSLDRTLKLWRRDRGFDRLFTLEGHGAAIRAALVTADGNIAYSASADATIRKWDLQTGLQLAELAAGGPVRSIAMARSGTRLFYGTDHGSIGSVDLARFIRGKTIRNITHSVFALDVSPDGNFLVWSNNKTLCIWDLRHEREERTLEGHFDSIRTAVFVEDGASVLSGGADLTVRLWDVESGEQLASLYPGHSAWVISVASFGSSNRVASVSFDRCVRVWNLSSGFSGPNEGRQHDRQIRGLATAGRQVVSASFDGTLKLWDIDKGVALWQSQPVMEENNRWARNQVIDVAITDDGTFAISAHSDGVIRQWDLQRRNRASVKELRSDDFWPDDWDESRRTVRDVFGVAVSPDGKVIASASEDRLVRVWDARGFSVRKSVMSQHESGVNTVALSMDGNVVVSGSDDKNVRLWKHKDSNLSKVLLAPSRETSHDDEVLDVAIRQDGRMALSGSKDGTVRCWNLETGVQLKTLTGHKDWILGVAFIPGGPWAVSASKDRHLKLWQLDQGVQIASYEVNTPLYSCAVGAGGSVVIAGDGAGYLHYWDIEDVLLTYAATRAGGGQETVSEAQ